MADAHVPHPGRASGADAAGDEVVAMMWLLLLGALLGYVLFVAWWDARRERKARRRLLDVVTRGWAPDHAGVDAALREDAEVAELEHLFFEVPPYEVRP